MSKHVGWALPTIHNCFNIRTQANKTREETLVAQASSLCKKTLIYQGVIHRLVFLWS